MKCIVKIIPAAMSALLLCIGITAAQVGPDGNLSYTLSNSQPSFAAKNSADMFIIRNRLDSGNTWTLSADALIMTRSGGKTSSLLLNAVTGAELFNSKDFNFPWAAGPRVGIVGEDILFGCDIEASYFGIDGWEARKDIVAPLEGAEFRLFNQMAFVVPADGVISYNYVSRLHSTEINLRHPCWERLSVFGGFRYVELHEDLLSTVDNVQIFDVNVDNHLYGGQIGMAVAFISRPRISIEGVMKAGVFGNYSDLTMPVISTHGYGDQTSHTAFLGEIGLMGIFQVTNQLAARIGYQAMWLDGIAIAGDQVENVNPLDPKPYIGGTLFYHGAFAGLEFAY